jgi:hypothetical protein
MNFLTPLSKNNHNYISFRTFEVGISAHYMKLCLSELQRDIVGAYAL